MGSLFAKDVIAKAASYVGYHEGPNNDNYFAEKLSSIGYFLPQTDKNHVPWCAIFLDYCATFAALPEDREDDSKMYDAQYFLYQPSYNNYSASAPTMAAYFKAANAWYGTPHPGDFIFFQNESGIYHVGIVEEFDDETITAIEGNADNQVLRRYYNYEDCIGSKIAGFGRPRYDEAGEDQDSAPDPNEDIIEKRYNAEVTIRYKDNKPINFKIDLL